MDVTEKLKAFDVIRESEEKLRNFVGNSSDAIFLINARGEIVEWNQGAESIFKVNKADAVGKKHWDIQYQLIVEEKRNKASYQKLKENTLEFFTGATSDIYSNDTLEFQLPDGSRKWVVSSSTKITINDRTFAGIICKDITPRIVSEKTVGESELRFRNIADNINEVFWISNPASTELDYASKAFERIWEEPLEKLRLKPDLWLDSVDEKDRENIIININRQALGENTYCEFRIRDKNGNIKWISNRGYPVFDDEGKIHKVSGIFEDISFYKNYEGQLLKAKEKAEESDQLKSAFLANMSHEIRTPLNAIMGFNQLLKKTNLSAEKREMFAEIIEKSGEQLLNIINDIIDISKIESGQIDLQYEDFDLNELICEIKLIFNSSHILNLSKAIELIIDEKYEEETFNIKGERSKLLQILTNLVRNAYKFTIAGQIRLGYIINPGVLTFFVKDTGIGIAKDKQEIIFERFRQVDDSNSRNYSGTGLGLSISKGLIEKMGGKIWLESSLKKGSTFFFTMPYSEVSETEYFKDQSEPKTYAWPDKTLLIVEDSRPSAEYFKELCAGKFKNIYFSYTGEDAVRFCERNDDIDLILMDIRLPKINGLKAAKEILSFRKNIIIIAQSANVMKDTVKNSIKAGCAEIISKPINSKKLFEIIEKYLNPID